MRDIEEVLSRWGVWSIHNAGVDYSHIAAGFKGLITTGGKSKPSCTDDDGLIIDSCVAALKNRRPDEFDLLVQHYVMNVSKRALAKKLKKDEKLIRISLQLAGGFIDGCLSTLDITLDMER